GLDRTRGEDHFAIGVRLVRAPAVKVLDARRTPALEEDPRGVRARDQREIAAREDRAQERHRGARSPAVTDRELVGAHAVVHRTVEVVGLRKSGLPRRLEPCAAIGMVVAQVGDAELPARAVVVGLSALVAFGALEERQHAAVVPTLCTEAGPFLIVAAL